MDRPDHAHTELVIGRHQRKVFAQGVRILNRHKDHALALCGDWGGIIGFEGKAKHVGAARQHLPDHHSAQKTSVAGFVEGLRRPRTLACVDDPEATIEPTFLHTWNIDLGESGLPIMGFEDIKARARHHGWGV